MNTTTTADRPALAFYNANCKCTGCAAKFELYPANGLVGGSILLRLAKQMPADPSANPPAFPSFDWTHEISVRLTFDDLCRILQVLRGETESIADGKGIFHHSRRAATALHLCHVVEPCSCYKLEARRRMIDDPNDDTQAAIFLVESEALGLRLAIENSIGLIAFGIPSEVMA